MNTKSIFLLSNDDGYKSLGIQYLRNYLLCHGTVILVAPRINKSACSSSLTVNKQIKITKINNREYIVNGTSADCVNIATRGLLSTQPDYVISGINFGSNMGDDVVYSGTIGAAIEGRFCKKISVAISITNKKPRYLDDIEKKLNLFLPKLLKMKNSSDILNVNIPDMPFSKLKGVKYTKLGKRLISKRANIIINKKSLFADIGDVGNPKSYSVGTDFHAIKSGYISITPISIDMTDYEKLLKYKNE